MPCRKPLLACLPSSMRPKTGMHADKLMDRGRQICNLGLTRRSSAGGALLNTSACTSTSRCSSSRMLSCTSRGTRSAATSSAVRYACSCWSIRRPLLATYSCRTCSAARVRPTVPVATRATQASCKLKVGQTELQGACLLGPLMGHHVAVAQPHALTAGQQLHQCRGHGAAGLVSS